jgi:hypothetical protein
VVAPKAEPVFIPERLLEKLHRAAEFRMGVKRVAIVLFDGRTFRPAFVSGTEIRRVGEPGDGDGAVRFNADEIADLIDESAGSA